MKYSSASCTSHACLRNLGGRVKEMGEWPIRFASGSLVGGCLVAALILCPNGRGQQITSTAGPASSAPAHVGTLHFNLRLTSIQPATVTVPTGRYLISVTNGILPAANLSIKLTGSTASSDLAAVKANPGQSKKSMVVDLPVGTYTLTVAESSKWKSVINVTK